MLNTPCTSKLHGTTYGCNKLKTNSNKQVHKKHMSVCDSFVFYYFYAIIKKTSTEPVYISVLGYLMNL